MAWCPFYLGKSMCGAKDSGLYVPPKEVEFKYCADKFSKCKIYRAAEKHSTASGAGSRNNVTEGKKEWEPPD